MAKLNAATAFVYETVLLDLDALLQGSTRRFDDDVPRTWEGVEYPDSYWLEFPPVGGVMEATAFGGADLAGSDASLTGGSVTAMHAEWSADGATWNPRFTLFDFSVSATTLWGALQTADAADDELVFASIFSGHDEIVLAGGDDRMRGHVGADSLHGNGGADWLSGDAGNDTLDGGTRNDTLQGGVGDDSLEGGAGADVLEGGSGNDAISGGLDGDRLGGGLGADTMRGGAGSDFYVVDSRLDKVLEHTVEGARHVDSGGFDTVLSGVSYRLGSFIEQLLLTGSASTGHGNGRSNTIVGTSGDNNLHGYEGNDLLEGRAGTDLLYGGDGSDTIDGGFGADLVSLGANWNFGGDSDSAAVIVAGANNDRGQDTLRNFDPVHDTILISGNVASFEHGVDTAVGTAAGTETSGSRSSFAANVGLVDIVQLTDSVWSDSGDIVITFEGTAPLSEAAFEACLQYSLNASSGDDVLTGGDRDDGLVGNNGNDTLTGGLGADRLTGGGGQDVFRFNAAAESSGFASRRDAVLAFERGADRLDLSGIDADAAAAGNQVFSATFLAANAAFTAAGQLRFSGGVLFGNTDGDADAEFSIQVTGVTSLSSADVIL